MGAEPATGTPQPVPASGGLSGFNGTRRVPTPVNEPVRSYAPGSPERAYMRRRKPAPPTSAPMLSAKA